MLSYLQGGMQYAAYCLNIHLSMMIKPFLPEIEMSTLCDLIAPLRDKVLDKLANIIQQAQKVQKTAKKPNLNLRQFERRMHEYNDKNN